MERLKLQKTLAVESVALKVLPVTAKSRNGEADMVDDDEGVSDRHH